MQELLSMATDEDKKAWQNLHLAKFKIYVLLDSKRESKVKTRLFFFVSTSYSTDVQAIKGIGAGCDEEAVRVISRAKKWSPKLFSCIKFC